jgi:hypothetical protein
MFGLGVIGQGLRMIRELIGRPLREFAEWADKNPGAAARYIDSLAIVLRGRADAIAERRGNRAWRVRRDRHLAMGFERYATQLRDEARQREAENRRTNICAGFEDVCRDALVRAKAA